MNPVSNLIMSLNTNTAPRKQRKRVPISCLNCKKRKVKCDKGKPACGGCVKNQVPESCHYVEPAWAVNDRSSNGESLNNHTLATATNTTDYSQLKSSTDIIILNQRKEIEDLKRQLSALKNFPPKHLYADADDVLNATIKILHKLIPSIDESTEKAEILEDHYFTFKNINNTAGSSDQLLQVYSWLNIIKLDPYLTNLWYKITNLQKVYHLYKMNMISNKSSSGNAKSNSVPKKSNYKVNEIDFTYTLGKSSLQNGDISKCPVVECDLNFMTDDINNISTPKSSMSIQKNIAESINNVTKPVIKSEFSIDKVTYGSLRKSERSLYEKIRTTWEYILHNTKGNERMNINQLKFLFDVYFNKPFDAESKNILMIFKNEVYDNFQNMSNATLRDSGLDSNVLLDAETPGFLKMKAIYISMFGIIVEESLDCLRLNLKDRHDDKLAREFKRIFPSEICSTEFGYNDNSSLITIQELIGTLNNGTTRTLQVDQSLAYVVICLSMLNRHISLYRRQLSSIPDPKSGFTMILKLLLNLVNNKNKDGVQIWRDPSLLSFSGSDDRKKKIKLHLCYVWNDFMRIINLVCFDSVSLVMKDEELKSSIINILIKVEKADISLFHIRYLACLKPAGFDQLSVSLHVNHLIARCFISLYNSIAKVSGTHLTRSALQRITNEAFNWSNNTSLCKLNHMRLFEVKCTLQYLGFYLSYLLLLHSEEMNEESFVKNEIVELFSKGTEYALLLQKFIVSKHAFFSSQYALVAVTETAGRLVQLTVGLLVRFRSLDESSDSNLLYIKETEHPIHIESKLKDQLVKNIDLLLILLMQSKLTDKKKVVKLSKLWNFYLTFLKSSQKMNSSGYAKIHADIPGIKFTKNLYKCPVVSGEQVEIKKDMKDRTTVCPMSDSITRDSIGHDLGNQQTNFEKCPIDHETMSRRNNSAELQQLTGNRTGKCPIDHEYLSGGISMVSNIQPGLDTKKGRKCPFDHEALRSGIMPKGFIESHVRGSKQIKKPKLGSASKEISVSGQTLDPQKSSDSLATEKPSSLPLYNLYDPPLPYPSFENFAMNNDSNPMTNLGGFNLNDFPNFDFDFLQNELWFEQLGINGIDNTEII